MIDIETGNHTVERVTRGPLMVQKDPPCLYWRGQRGHLTPRQAGILYHLAKHGAASNLAMQLIGSGEDAMPNTVKVNLCQLRKKLPTGVHIESRHGWGYEITVEGE
jgi:DNA-binding response OmpR family regulator